MENIKHQIVAVNGINIHVAEIGDGPAVLFLHGFPELWYSWRHQMQFLSSKGYRAIAPDLRGYGDSDVPTNYVNYTSMHIVGDIVGVLDALKIDKVFLVGHDWGASIAWQFCLYRPDRIKALVNLSVPFRPRNPAVKPVDGMRSVLGDDFYICRFQKPGEVEEEFSKVDTTDLIKAFLTGRDPSPPCIPKEVGFHSIVNGSNGPLPTWLTIEDVDYYANKFNKTGFTGGLNYYRALDLSWELSAAWTGSRIELPVKFIIGDLDLTYNFPGVQEYINKGGFKKDVPNLEFVVIQGAAHFINQEIPDQINNHIFQFIIHF